MLMRSPLLFGGCWLHTCVHPWYLKNMQWQFCTNMWIKRHKSKSPSFPISAGLWQETSDPMMPRNKPKWGICSPEIFGHQRLFLSLRGEAVKGSPRGIHVKRSWWQCAKSYSNIELQTPQQALQWEKKNSSIIQVRYWRAQLHHYGLWQWKFYWNICSVCPEVLTVKAFLSSSSKKTCKGGSNILTDNTTNYLLTTISQSLWWLPSLCVHQPFRA